MLLIPLTDRSCICDSIVLVGAPVFAPVLPSFNMTPVSGGTNNAKAANNLSSSLAAKTLYECDDNSQLSIFSNNGGAGLDSHSTHALYNQDSYHDHGATYEIDHVTGLEHDHGAKIKPFSNDHQLQQAQGSPIEKFLGTDDILCKNIFPFLGVGQFAFVAPVCKLFKSSYIQYCESVPNPPEFNPYQDRLEAMTTTAAPYHLPRVVEDPVWNREITTTATPYHTFYSAAATSFSRAQFWIDDGRRNPIKGNGSRLFLCTAAAKAGNVQVLKWAVRMNFPWYKNLQTSIDAALNGHLDVLQFAHENGCPWNEWTCEAAALNGHLEALKFIHNNHCTWDKKTCEAAAWNGHLEVLKYAHGKKCCPLSETTFSNAASNGHLEVMEYLHEQNCPWDANTTHCAAENGHLECLKFAHDKGCEWADDSDTCCMAATNEHWDVLDYAIDNGAVWDDAYVCFGAAYSGNLEHLKKLHKKGVPWDASACQGAAHSGNLEMLKYLRKEGCDWDEWTCSTAAEEGHLDVLKFAHENGCPWNSFTCSEAACNGHLDVLKYAHENGCPWDAGTCASAASEGDLDVLTYVLTNGCPRDEYTCLYAATCPSLDALKLARKYGCQWHPDLISNVNEYCFRPHSLGRIKKDPTQVEFSRILKWARENGCPEP